MTQGKDGKVYVQAGKIGLWTVEVTGLETIQSLPGGTISLDQNDTKQALAFRDKAVQQAAIPGRHVHVQEGVIPCRNGVEGRLAFAGRRVKAVRPLASAFDQEHLAAGSGSPRSSLPSQPSSCVPAFRSTPCSSSRTSLPAGSWMTIETRPPVSSSYRSTVCGGAYPATSSFKTGRSGAAAFHVANTAASPGFAANPGAVIWKPPLPWGSG
jgi:hypothetical protein